VVVDNSGRTLFVSPKRTCKLGEIIEVFLAQSRIKSIVVVVLFYRLSNFTKINERIEQKPMKVIFSSFLTISIDNSRPSHRNKKYKRGVSCWIRRVIPLKIL
jgi:hypothetical protein